jgi:enoyl reductase
MRAVVFDRFGPPEILRVADLPDPQAGRGQVRIRVHAAGVQPFDVGVRSGAMRYVPVAFPQQSGQEYAGVVDQVGDGVTGRQVGDEVMGSTMLDGAAEYVVAAAENVVAKPPQLDYPTAAGLVAAAQTASGALRELRVAPGETLLVHAAAGSVGTVAVQLARLDGVTVIGTASPANHEYLRSLGAIPVEYGEGLVERVRAAAPQGVDVALDAAGRGAIAASVQLVADRDRIGTIVDDAAAAEFGARVVRAGRSPERLAEVAALAARGRLVMPIRAYPLDEVVQAHRVVESGHGHGKVVLTV